MSISIADLTRNADLRTLLGGFLSAIQNRCVSKAGLAIHGTNAENVLTAHAIDYTVGDQFYTLAAQTEIDISAVSGYTPTALADGNSRFYLFCADAAGAISVVEGAAVASAAAAVMPDPGATTPFGAVRVDNASGSDFTFGTTGLSVAGVTDAYFDLARPLSGAGAIAS